MVITRLRLGEFATNCYIIQGPQSDVCIVIDPADNGPEICRTLQALGTIPQAVLLTHSHFDHILAVPYLQQQWPNLPVFCHSLDCPKETTEKYNGKIYPTVSAFQNLCHYSEGETITAGGLNVQVIFTPGHTPGSVVLIIENAMFTGDTLFKGSICRTDFEGGDSRAMMSSLRRLAALQPDYDVYPGHNESTTLNSERAFNPYLKILQER
ncbi:MAG: MBL fold metallo-hydrolase [Clostridiales bacterium]|nr:MBL fold metallo-hydrolase [Clostridiales bacterium]